MADHCIDCGSPTGGVRCRPCADRVRREQALVSTAAADRALLAMVDEPGMNKARIGTRLGISRARVGVKIREAREREQRRSTGGVSIE